MSRSAPRLLVVAHGTASAAGRTTTERLVAAVAAARPHVTVEHCYLDVVTPRLAERLDHRPTVVVPALLSTGYHVQQDIPALVAPFPETSVARHLGPHDLLTDVLVDHLPAGARATVLVAAGSSRPEAADELRAAAELLGARLDETVAALTVGDELASLPTPFRVATYLLTEGQFADRLRAAAAPFGGLVADPLGVHPALVDLVWLRYDEACSQVR